MQRDSFEVLPFPDLSGFRPKKRGGRRLRVCIVTEEIFGPVRNGGISSTYMYLARMLADAGHDVTVLYLKGTHSEKETIEYWIGWYAEKGVTLVPLPKTNVLDTQKTGTWQRRHFSCYHWLRSQQDFDIIHTSEWRGGTYYALLAKSQGLAFQNTLFLMKTSSPHVWNRHYQMQFLGDRDALQVMYPEQACVELADIVIGGSAHLLRFMEHVGYTLPEGRTFVQPNVIEFADLDIVDKRPPYKVGDLVSCDELAFFGRLETRKGLEVFCEALDYLVARGTPPSKVSFLGKPGALFSAPHLNSEQFIRKHAERWPFPIELHMDFNQLEVISFLTGRPRIAVMPSLIENSTMAVYEALIYRIPFIASNSGGTPELVGPEFRDEVLVDANPRELANGLERVLTRGARVAGCAFDNQENLSVWQQFHEYLAERFTEADVNEIRDAMSYAPSVSVHNEDGNKISACIIHLGDTDNLIDVVSGLCPPGSQDAPDQIIVAAHDLPDEPAALNSLKDRLPVPDSVSVVVISANELSLGEAYNCAAEAATGEALVFLRSDIHTPEPSFLSTFRRALASSPACIFSCFYEIETADGHERSFHAPIGGDLASGFFNYMLLAGHVIAVRASMLGEVGGFSPIYGVGGVEQELVVRALLNNYGVEVIPEALYVERPDRQRIALNEVSAQYHATKELMHSVPYAMRRVFLVKSPQAQYKLNVKRPAPLINFKNTHIYRKMKSTEKSVRLRYKQTALYRAANILRGYSRVEKMKPKKT